MQNNEILSLLTGLLVIINSAQVILAAWKKLKPEVKKLDAEAESEAMETANLSLEGAQKGIQILRDQVVDLQKQISQERETWKIELDKERELRRSELEAEKTARRRKVAYLEQRIKEAEREARDYRIWAAKLVKQVTELGGIPTPLILTPPDDTDQTISQKIEAAKKEDNK